MTRTMFRYLVKSDEERVGRDRITGLGDGISFSSISSLAILSQRWLPFPIVVVRTDLLFDSDPDRIGSDEASERGTNDTIDSKPASQPASQPASE